MERPEEMHGAIFLLSCCWQTSFFQCRLSCSNDKKTSSKFHEHVRQTFSQHCTVFHLMTRCSFFPVEGRRGFWTSCTLLRCPRKGISQIFIIHRVHRGWQNRAKCPLDRLSFPFLGRLQYRVYYNSISFLFLNRPKHPGLPGPQLQGESLAGLWVQYC